jgi:hypothetical protein
MLTASRARECVPFLIHLGEARWELVAAFTDSLPCHEAHSRPGECPAHWLLVLDGCL